MLTLQDFAGTVEVANTNSNRYQKSAVRVYVNGLKVGQVYPPKYNPLGYLRDHPQSKYCHQLLAQLDRIPLAPETLLAIFAHPQGD